MLKRIPKKSFNIFLLLLILIIVVATYLSCTRKNENGDAVSKTNTVHKTPSQVATISPDIKSTSESTEITKPESTVEPATTPSTETTKPSTTHTTTTAPPPTTTAPTTTPAPSPKSTTTTAKQYVMIGDTKEDVISVMGAPSCTFESMPELDYWYNGSSCMIFLYDKGDGYKVIGWDNYNNFLKVSMGQKIDSAPPVTLGSSKNDVVKALGTPTWNSPFFGIKNDNFPQWDYDDGQYVIFDNNYKVIAWNNKGGLKVSLGDPDPNAQPVGIGSTWNEVAKALGTPMNIHVSGPSTIPQSFSYSNCYLEFNFNGIVDSVINKGNPKVKN